MADTVKTEESRFQEIYESTRSNYTIVDIGTLDAKKGCIQHILPTTYEGETIVTVVQGQEEFTAFKVKKGFDLRPIHYNETFRFNRFVAFVESKMLEREKFDANLAVLSEFKTIVDRRHRQVLNLASHITKEAVDRSALLLTTCVVELSNFIESNVDIKACTATSGEEFERELLEAIDEYSIEKE
jgi:hypothetical protein